jgi:hypothetical protein
VLYAVVLPRLAGASAADSQPAAQRSLDLADDAESNMPLSPWRSSLKRMHHMSCAGQHKVRYRWALLVHAGSSKVRQDIRLAAVVIRLCCIARSARPRCCSTPTTFTRCRTRWNLRSEGGCSGT